MVIQPYFWSFVPSASSHPVCYSQPVGFSFDVVDWCYLFDYGFHLIHLFFTLRTAMADTTEAVKPAPKMTDGTRGIQSQRNNLKIKPLIPSESGLTITPGWSGQSLYSTH
ncbi:hypothetical protein FRC03_005607 [Tulasnella sp. 419]|nr:hypothetical protein FRC03_005607 [Tulasnella sp. 419]